jgi:hypothetical protein
MAAPRPPAATYRDEADDGGENGGTAAARDYHDDEYHDDEPVTAPGGVPPFLRLEDEEYESVSSPARSPGLSGTLDLLPHRLRRVWSATARWVRGPQPPRPWRITPYFERWQTLPVRTLDRFFPKRSHKAALLAGFYAAWLLTFSLLLKKSAFAVDVEGYGAPVTVGCLARFWSVFKLVGRVADANGSRSRHNLCGLNGDFCRPFDNSTFAFRCPASCGRTSILEPYAVGSQMINYMPLVIGGPVGGAGASGAVYRGDSFICSAAIHSGYLRDKDGGCGVAKMVGERSSYPAYSAHGMNSIEFDSWFPQSFEFIKGTSAQCRDLRWNLLAVSVVYSAVLSLFTTSPSIFFCSIFTGLFTHVALVSDPPGNSDYRTLISTAIGRFVPAAFCMAVMYMIAVRYTLRNLTAQVEKTILWLGACWVGALNNYTFDKIPIQRLTSHDLAQQPGAITALITILITIASIMISQAWFIRIEGIMPKYLVIYAILIGGLLLLITVPGLNLRIHHYILALLLLPGTRLQMRPSLLYQGLLVGFFINGIARWGFDPILQTSFELRGEAPIGTILPTILPPIVHTNVGLDIQPNITFQWVFPGNATRAFDGISILVNDVERFKGYHDQGLVRWTWRRTHPGLPEYFRFAYMAGSETSDYTRAGTWDAEGGWREMAPGPS